MVPESLTGSLSRAYRHTAVILTQLQTACIWGRFLHRLKAVLGPHWHKICVRQPIDRRRFPGFKTVFIGCAFFTDDELL